MAVPLRCAAAWTPHFISSTMASGAERPERRIFLQDGRFGLLEFY